MASAAKPSQEGVPQLKAWSPYDYDSTALADIVLRSSDFTDFYVFKAFLRFVSPFFKNMFASPSSTDANEKVNGFTIIPVRETSETLRLLLDFIYRHEGEPKIDDVPLFLSVCKATQKYSMNIIENRLRKQIITSHLMDTDPLRLYAAAINFSWKDAALIATQKASQIPQPLPKKGLGKKGKPAKFDPKTLMTLPILRTGFGAPAPTPSPIPAQKPFDSAAKADVIIRSKDLIDFFILADLVHVVSASFSNITPISMGKTIGETEDGRAIISVPEDSEVLRHLLGLIYQISDETEPLRVYIIASALCWDDVAKSAALNTLSEPLEDMTYMQEFDLITGADLYQLVAFRFKCADAACEVITSNSDFNTYGPGEWYSTGSQPDCHRGPAEQVFLKLRSCPRGSTIVEAYDLEAKGLESRGDYCRTYCPTLAQILKCRRAIENAVEEAVSKVPLAI